MNKNKIQLVIAFLNILSSRNSLVENYQNSINKFEELDENNIKEIISIVKILITIDDNFEQLLKDIKTIIKKDL